MLIQRMRRRIITPRSRSVLFGEPQAPSPQRMIRLADYSVYATDEGLFILKEGESNVTKVARPRDMHRLSDDLAAAWRDVQGEAGDLPAAPTKTPDKPTRKPKGAGDYDPTDNKCKECGSSNIFMSEGCMTCQDCAWSKCS